MEKITAEMSELSPEESGADRKLLIAVDFGTTYSGVAWAQTRRVVIPSGRTRNDT
jgi:molecular chaperone DnaK (HSP70)